MNFVRKHGAASCALGALAFAASLAVVPAYATTTTGTITVTASVATTCTVNSPTLAFGSYDATKELDTTATVSVQCTQSGTGATASVALDSGLHSANATSPYTRALSDGSSHYLNYDIYTDSNHTTVWGGSTTVSAAENGSAVTLTAYGKLPASQTLIAGSYTDTVGITVTF